MDKLIITSALTGAITVPSQTPYLPFTPDQIADDAAKCAQVRTMSDPNEQWHRITPVS